MYIFNSFVLVIDFQHIYICICLNSSTIFAINKYMLQKSHRLYFNKYVITPCYQQVTCCLTYMYIYTYRFVYLQTLIYFAVIYISKYKFV